jgi:hypothetical protein
MKRLLIPRPTSRRSSSTKAKWPGIEPRGTSEEESAATLKKVVALAVRMRADAFGYEPCAQYTPVGSHVRKTRVCADAAHGRDRPDGASSDR